MFRTPTVVARRLFVQRRLLSAAPAEAAEAKGVSSAMSFDVAKPATWPSVKDSMHPENLHARDHAKGTTKWWLNFNIFFTVPALVAVAYLGIPGEVKHIKHLSEHPNEYVEHPHLRKRKNVRI
ncbi:hypothetical protein HDU67_009209 [Dinochytrium kinnereticum]|nr:hypothetical protein HDU67_009209 [Dinochytrium kinnereticum]